MRDDIHKCCILISVEDTYISAKAEVQHLTVCIMVNGKN